MSDWNNTHDFNHMLERDMANRAEGMLEEELPEIDSALLEGVKDTDAVINGLVLGLLEYAAAKYLHDFNNDEGVCHCVFHEAFLPVAENMDKRIAALTAANAALEKRGQGLEGAVDKLLDYQRRNGAVNFQYEKYLDHIHNLKVARDTALRAG